QEKMASVVLPDGVRDVPDGSTVAELAAGINPRLARIAIAARVDDRLVDLSHKLRSDIRAEILTEDHAESLAIMRHSTAHVLAQAVRRLYGADVQYTIGPAIENGFYYYFQFSPGATLSPEELPKIEAEMKKVIDANFPSEREEVTCEVARTRMRGEGQRFKDEIITELEDKGERIVSLYRQGDFLDLCRGPHVPSTGRIKGVKLTRI